MPKPSQPNSSSKTVPGHSFQSDNPYQAPASPLDTNQGDGIRYGEFWRRLVAGLIDGLLMVLLLAPISITLAGHEDTSLATISVSYSGLFVEYFMPLLITVCFWFFFAATPGKMLLGLKIVDANHGGKPKLFQLLIRYIGYFPSMIVIFLGFIWIAIDQRKQGWHDKVAETIVVRK